MIKDETAGISWARSEVLDVEIERLHDASREQNTGIGCVQAESTEF